MADNQRLTRVENKVDTIKEDVSELKTEVRVSFSKIENRMDTFGAHVAQDQKIINKIGPLLDKLPEIHQITEMYRFDQMTKAIKKEKLKSFSKKLGLISLGFGFIITIFKIATWFPNFSN
jgi:uncharacterized coiled-coil DUF342 family protein